MNELSFVDHDIFSVSKLNEYFDRFDIKRQINVHGPSEGYQYFDGYDWRVGDLSVSRSFGDMDAAPFVTHKPEIFKYSLSKGDKFIILGCDGLWDVINSQDAVNFVLEKLNDEEDIVSMSGHSKKNIAHELAKCAIKKGSTDNVSIIIIFF